MPYETKTDEFLKKLAQDTADGKVFTDKHIPAEFQAELTPIIFIPFTVLSEEQMQELKSYKPHLVFEYLDKAQSVGQLPTFMTMQILDEADSNKFWDYFEEIKKQKEGTN